MHLMYFTEQPYGTYPREEAEKFGYSTVLFSNKHFDPQEASRLYNERIEEYLYAEQMGVDGIMLNEHHNAPYCMQAKINIYASILAAMTKRVKLVLLGNPLPLSDNPIRLAEELGMIDLISKGRLVSGIVRGSGGEQLATNANPAYNRERFEEAHDLLIKAWTEPGPWRWEGNHYQLRVVNQWVTPYQKPHPRIWVPGIFSTETVVWSAEHRYPYIALNTTLEATKALWKIYDDAAARVGYTAGPEQRGYLIRCHVQDSEAKAHEGGRKFMWMQGEFLGKSHPYWTMPSGYGSPSTRRQRLGAKRPAAPAYEQQIETLQIIAGTPDQVVKKLRVIMEETRPSILALWANDGDVSHKDSMNCIRLLGQEVMPALRDIGKSLGLNSPFEANSPVSLAATPKSQLKPAKITA